MTIDLLPEVERALADEARQKGTTLQALANDYLLERVHANGSDAAAPPGSMAEFLGEFLGMLPPDDLEAEDRGARAPAAHDEFTAILLAKEARRRG
ncbi:MAG TPA: hypothetical protein VFQ45_05680 [Longimicrobium sp.]|nr:hypothetical protein [Longimicrobium sp.]